MGGVIPTKITFTSQSQPQGTSSNVVNESIVVDSSAPHVPPSPEGPLIGLTMIDDGIDTSVGLDTDMNLDIPPALPNPIHPTYLSSLKVQTPTPKSNSVKKAARPPPELIPPSRRTNLPSNIIVTSVDVESDLWGGQGGVTSVPDVVEEGLEFDRLERDVGAKGSSRTEKERQQKDREHAVDWSGLDDSWDSLKPLELSVLEEGSIVAWQVCARCGDSLRLVLFFFRYL